MKKYVLIFSVLLAGCHTNPAIMKFPEPPITEKCPVLKTIDNETILLSELVKIISSNYTKYNECSEKNNAWLEWYEKQKNIVKDTQ